MKYNSMKKSKECTAGSNEKEYPDAYTGSPLRT